MTDNNSERANPIGEMYASVVREVLASNTGKLDEKYRDHNGLEWQNTYLEMRDKVRITIDA